MAKASPTRLTFVGKREITLNGQAITYTIKSSPRTKCARLEVRSDTGLTVVIPRYYELDWLPDLLKGKDRWILSKMAKYRQIRSLMAEKELESGDAIPYLGQDREVVTQQSHRNMSSVKLERKKLIVSIGVGNGGLNLVLERWYRTQAGELIREKADKISAHLGVRYNRLIIRGQRARWGSCSQKGNLSFNWRLAMAPEPVIDYVIIHELAHLKEMNHSKKFWELVAKHCTQWRKHKRWLKEHEAELLAKLSG
ncbi:M48 family metallopeptidase [Chloroflexota bacterium]